MEATVEFSKTPLAPLILQELFSLAEGVKHHCAVVFEKTPPPDPGRQYINADPIVPV